MSKKIDEEISLDSTFPTDISISQDENSEIQTTDDYPFTENKCKINTTSKNKKCCALEQKLRHEILKLNVSLKEKLLRYDNLKSQSSKRICDLEEALEQSSNELQVLRMQSLLQKQEVQTIKEDLESKLVSIQATQNMLKATSVDIQRTLSCLNMTEGQYQQLLMHPADEISLTDFISMKLYEKELEWKQENSLLKSKIKMLTDERNENLALIEKLQNELDTETRHKFEYEIKYHRSSNTCEALQNDIQTGNYKIDNYDKINREKEEYFEKMENSLKDLSLLKISYDKVYKERDELHSEVLTMKQSIVLLSKDKDYFLHQITDLNNKIILSEEKLQLMNEQLEKSKLLREELYEKYITSRDQYKREYDDKLTSELDQIKSQTNVEIERLKMNTRELYERENRSLRESRDNAISEKDRAIASEKETQNKYDQLVQDFREHQLSGDGKMSDAFNEVKMKTFELQRTQLLYDETLRNLKDLQISNEKLHKKLEVSTREYYTMQSSLDKQITELESRLSEKSIKLETYEKLEQELDEVILQAADMKTEDQAERVLFSYGYGANIPSTAKRRLKQSVHLAQRVLQLERANTSLRKELDLELMKSKQLREEIRSSNEILNDARQPQHYLVESIRQRDLLIGQLKQQIELLEQDISKIKEERSELIKSKNEAILDLERLLNHEEEFTLMKQVILGLQNEKPPKSFQPSAYSRQNVKAEKDDNVLSMPKPTVFTRSNNRLSHIKQKIQQDLAIKKNRKI